MKKTVFYLAALWMLSLYACNDAGNNKTAANGSDTTVAEKWSVEKANQWYAAQPWYVGANFYLVRLSTSWKCGREILLIALLLKESWPGQSLWA
ncbi:hypothetical protein [Niabella hibiscisoli]|uniref:hypothetical protein n=1 Tax=Niabella hibiscisoli TaxID=1825928 RepID=UPI001F118FE7|nr:hypothetical protein [Niabella hibiscisoli]MCH5720580.1 hypothetical protein [Niabella hibiscisoli]